MYSSCGIVWIMGVDRERTRDMPFHFLLNSVQLLYLYDYEWNSERKVQRDSWMHGRLSREFVFYQLLKKLSLDNMCHLFSIFHSKFRLSLGFPFDNFGPMFFTRFESIMHFCLNHCVWFVMSLWTTIILTITVSGTIYVPPRYCTEFPDRWDW